ncbi:MAG: hypothetical protein SPL30_03245 [Succinivibrio sp.]|nr:hypothetical protein [Succinivibrio sp.]
MSSADIRDLLGALKREELEELASKLFEAAPEDLQTQTLKDLEGKSTGAQAPAQPDARCAAFAARLEGMRKDIESGAYLTRSSLMALQGRSWDKDTASLLAALSKLDPKETLTLRVPLMRLLNAFRTAEERKLLPAFKPAAFRLDQGLELIKAVAALERGGREFSEDTANKLLHHVIYPARWVADGFSRDLNEAAYDALCLTACLKEDLKDFDSAQVLMNALLTPLKNRLEKISGTLSDAARTEAIERARFFGWLTLSAASYAEKAARLSEDTLASRVAMLIASQSPERVQLIVKEYVSRRNEGAGKAFYRYFSCLPAETRKALAG